MLKSQDQSKRSTSLFEEMKCKQQTAQTTKKQNDNPNPIFQLLARQHLQWMPHRLPCSSMIFHCKAWNFELFRSVKGVNSSSTREPPKKPTTKQVTCTTQNGQHPSLLKVLITCNAIVSIVFFILPQHDVIIWSMILFINQTTPARWYHISCAFFYSVSIIWSGFCAGLCPSNCINRLDITGRLFLPNLSAQLLSPQARVSPASRQNFEPLARNFGKTSASLFNKWITKWNMLNKTQNMRKSREFWWTNATSSQNTLECQLMKVVLYDS